MKMICDLCDKDFSFNEVGYQFRTRFKAFESEMDCASCLDDFRKKSRESK